MAPLAFDLPAAPSLAIRGEATRFPVRRIFCIGRNYAAHAAEMGAQVDRETPIYFLKGQHAVVETGAEIAFPSATQDLHHEVEFTIALGATPEGTDRDSLAAAILGYGVGIDLTRRDLQAVSKAKRHPWDTSKDFENGAALGPLTRASAWQPGPQTAITLSVDGALRQSATLGEMIYTPEEILADLSRYYRLGAGDIIMTGTPAGVGPLCPGNETIGTVQGLAPIRLRILPES